VEYKYGRNIIEFGGGTSQPQTNAELYEMCEDVIDVAKKYSAQLIYTVGAFHTSRFLSKQPKTFVTTTTKELMEQVKNLAWKRPCSHFLSQVSMGLFWVLQSRITYWVSESMGRLMIRKYPNIERPRVFCSYWRD
jgi:hypothetical protein